MRYKIKTRVKSVERLERTVSAHMVGGTAIMTKEDLGWFVCFDGSWEQLHLGSEKPNLKVGQLVEITIEGL